MKAFYLYFGIVTFWGLLLYGLLWFVANYGALAYNIWLSFWKRTFIYQYYEIKLVTRLCNKRIANKEDLPTSSLDIYRMRNLITSGRYKTHLYHKEFMKLINKYEEAVKADLAEHGEEYTPYEPIFTDKV